MDERTSDGAYVTIDFDLATRFRFSCRRAVVLPTRLARLRFRRHIGSDGVNVADVRGITLGNLNHGHPFQDGHLTAVRCVALIRVHVTVYAVPDRCAQS
jgi:hypothetical protein